MQQRTTVRLPRDLLLRAKLRAAEQGRTLTSMIEDGLRLVVAEPAVAPRGERVMPPISKATGGPVPGFELADLAALRDAEDLDYVARMMRLE